MEVQKMFGEEQDRFNAIVSINPGAGGTEAQDWAEMLLRMYLRWSERKGFHPEIIDYLPGEEAGVKSVTFTVDGTVAVPPEHLPDPTRSSTAMKARTPGRAASRSSAPWECGLSKPMTAPSATPRTSMSIPTRH
jgi:hypothetical protein